MEDGEIVIAGALVYLLVFLIMKSSEGPSVILMIGDSITQQAANPAVLGFQAQLSQDYIRRVDVINRGMSGWTTKNWISKLPKLVKEWKYSPVLLVMIYLGTNDAALSNNTQYVPLQDYAGNLQSMVQTLKSSFLETNFIFITPAAVNDEAPQWIGYRKNARTKLYVDQCKSLAAQLHIPVIDLWTPTQGKQKEFLIDGLHLSTPGNVFVYQQIVAAIKSNYPTLTNDSLPLNFNL
ncbi:isoamyl acetate-hydrolyzing esterase 1 [Thraustotheca clavata]|uniref:Isoamyl acetate-hydrolyzing esterase 1 n=1 Tax=Thraustotheca clavata TaxID=74557 RepID=A0A1V9Z0J5_9STRA|nr:isoamyl acetate-hydrolyzing esterase 1 [Thraustotheca clavata]